MQNTDKTEGAQFVQWFGPLLDALRKLGGSGSPDEVVEQIATDLNVPDTFQNELTPSGQPRFRNQVAWARFYLVREGLLDSSRRGVWSLTEKGRNTALTHDQAADIFRRWVAIFSNGEKQKEPKRSQLRNKSQRKRALHPMTIVQKFLKFSGRFPLPVSSGYLNACCVRRVSLTLKSLDKVTTAASTAMAP